MDQFARIRIEREISSQQPRGLLVPAGLSLCRFAHRHFVARRLLRSALRFYAYLALYLMLCSVCGTACEIRLRLSSSRINARLLEQGVILHMSEVKGPVMDALKRSDFLHHLTGQIYLSQHAADLDLRGRPDEPHTAE